MLSRPHAFGKEMHLKDIWAQIRDNLWILAACFVVIVSTVAIVTFSQTPLYETRSRILVKTKMPQILSVSGVEEKIMPQTMYDQITFFNSQTMLIESTVIAEKVLRKFPALLDYPELKDIKEPVKAVRGMVKAKPVERSHIFDIVVTSSNPSLAADLANAVAEAYASYSIELVDETAKRIYSLLQEKLNNMREEFGEVQQSLLGEATKEEVYNPTEVQQINTAKLAAWSAAYADARTNRMQLETTLKQVKEIEQKGSNYYEISSIAANEIIATLRSKYVLMEIELSELLKNYTKRHPLVVEHLTKMEEINLKIRQEAQKIINTIQNDYNALKTQEQQFLNAIEEAQKASVDINRRTTNYTFIQRDVTLLEDSYNLVLEKLRQANLLEGLQMDTVTILERASAPSAPFTPKTKLNIFFSMIFSLFIGFAFIILKEYFDTSIRTPEDIEALNIPMLTLIPHTTEDVGKGSTRESFNSLRTALLFARGSKPNYMLLITSGMPKEGKTSVASNAGKTLAAAGDKVLLVDCDFRRPMLHNKFNIDRRRGGLTSYVMQREKQPFDAYIQNVAPNLDVIPCGPIPPDPPKILASPDIKNFFDEAKRRYNWVIIDSPPIVGLTDSTILATQCDAICLVIRRNHLDKAVGQRVIKHLQEINANILGAVFNDVDLGSAYYTRYYKYGGYYYYYYSSKEEKDKDTIAPLIERMRKKRADEKTPPPSA